MESGFWKPQGQKSDRSEFWPWGLPKPTFDSTPNSHEIPSSVPITAHGKGGHLNRNIDIENYNSKSDFEPIRGKPDTGTFQELNQRVYDWNSLEIYRNNYYTPGDQTATDPTYGSNYSNSIYTQPWAPQPWAEETHTQHSAEENNHRYTQQWPPGQAEAHTYSNPDPNPWNGEYYYTYPQINLTNEVYQWGENAYADPHQYTYYNGAGEVVYPEQYEYDWGDNKIEGARWQDDDSRPKQYTQNNEKQCNAMQSIFLSTKHAKGLL